MQRSVLLIPEAAWERDWRTTDVDPNNGHGFLGVEVSNTGTIQRQGELPLSLDGALQVELFEAVLAKVGFVALDEELVEIVKPTARGGNSTKALREQIGAINRLLPFAGSQIYL